MANRYQKIFSLDKKLFSQNAPIVVSAGALLKDSETNYIIVQLKFQNVSPQTIKSVSVELTQFDVAGRMLSERREYTYLDINARRDDFFGDNSAIVLQANETRSFSVEVKEVVFDDGTIWNGKASLWSEFDMQEDLASWLKDPELVNQYKTEYGDSSKYRPEERGDIWLCTCGELNYDAEAECHKCHASRSKLLSIDTDALNERKNKRIEEEKKASKKKKRIILIAVIVIAVIAAGIVLYNAFKPCELEQYIKDNGTKTVTVNGVDFNIPKGYNDLCISDGKTDPGEFYQSDYFVSADYEDNLRVYIDAKYLGRIDGKFDIDACVDNIIENDWWLQGWGENRKCSEVDVEGADSAYLLQVEHPKFKNPSYEDIEYDAYRYYYCILLIEKNVFFYELGHPLDSNKDPDDVVDEKTICELATVSVKGKQELSGISSEPFVPSYENVSPGAESLSVEANQEKCFVYDSDTVKEYQKLLEKNGCEIVSTNKDIFSGKVTYKKGNLKFDMKYKFGSDRSEKFDGELTIEKK